MGTEKIKISDVIQWASSDYNKWRRLIGSVFVHNDLTQLPLKDVDISGENFSYLIMATDPKDREFSTAEEHLSKYFSHILTEALTEESIKREIAQKRADVQRQLAEQKRADVQRRLAEQKHADEQWQLAEQKRADVQKQLEEQKRAKAEERHRRIKNIVKERKINVLYHFTPFGNLSGILQKGLLPRSMLKPGLEGSAPIFNDEIRSDRCKDASCCTIGFPNYKTFYKFQQLDDNKVWAVIGLNPSILWSHTCLFNETNAAKKRCSSLSHEERETVDALDAMFADRDSQKCPSGVATPSRQELGLTDDMTTDPQAEVLVKGQVPVTSMLYVAFKDLYSKNQAVDALSHHLIAGVEFKIDKKLFSPRHDYDHWTNQKEEPSSVHVGGMLDDKIPF